MESSRLQLFDLSEYTRDYSPREKYQERLLQRLEAHKTELRTIEQKISLTTQRLEDLEARRKELLASLSVGESLLSPMRALPVEMLQQIFIQVIPTISDEVFKKDRIFQPLWKGDVRPGIARTSLLLTCRRWKTVLEDCAEAWTTLLVDQSGEDAERYLQRCLHLSKTYPLGVYLFGKACVNYNSTVRLDAILKPRLQRLTHFFYYVDSKVSDPGIVLSLLRDRGPIWNNTALRYLRLGVTGQRIQPRGYLDLAPLPLKAVSLDESHAWLLASLHPSTLGNLELIQLVYTYVLTANSNFSRLQLCQNLVTLDLVFSEDLDHDPMAKAITLRSLRYLRISVNRMWSIGNLFTFLQAPALEHLSLHFISSRNSLRRLDIGSALAMAPLMLQADMLNRLTLEGMMLFGEYNQENFRAMPNLNRLELLACRLDPLFFEALLRDKESQLLLPTIKEIYLYLCHCYVPDVVAFVRRNSTNARVTMFPRSLSIEEEKLIRSIALQGQGSHQLQIFCSYPENKATKGNIIRLPPKEMLKQ